VRPRVIPLGLSRQADDGGVDEMGQREDHDGRHEAEAPASEEAHDADGSGALLLRAATADVMRKPLRTKKDVDAQGSRHGSQRTGVTRLVCETWKTTTRSTAKAPDAVERGEVHEARRAARLGPRLAPRGSHRRTLTPARSVLPRASAPSE